MEQKEIWDKLYRSNLKWKLEARNLPQILKGKRVLELGAGNGKTLRSIIKQKPYEIIALDFSKAALEILHKEFPHIKLIQSDIISMPFEDESFDYIVCYFTLNNLLEKERKKAVKEIYRVLKKSGTLLFSDFVHGDFREKGSETESHTIEKKNGIICHFFDPRELKQLLNKFKSFKIKLLEFSQIKNKPNLKRKIIIAEIKK